MTQKVKERLLNASISALTAGGAVVLAFTLSTGETKGLNIQKELKEKAPYEYVDNQDDAVKQIIYDYKTDHQTQHTAEFNSLDGKLQLIIDHWNIKPESKDKKP